MDINKKSQFFQQSQLQLVSFIEKITGVSFDTDSED